MTGPKRKSSKQDDFEICGKSESGRKQSSLKSVDRFIDKVFSLKDILSQLLFLRSLG